MTEKGFFVFATGLITDVVVRVVQREIRSGFAASILDDGIGRKGFGEDAFILKDGFFRGGVGHFRRGRDDV